ncbi:hypothetical protein [Fodinicola feengrottensis]|uniref:hypothetical protein n=1 Tax=Fodinicola feengrottensis TaxID=435914 RepID=UPI0024413208|nr:hypothetical protein [Fodinicola feengrottensis]
MAPTTIAARAEMMFFSRSRPAGNATAAWKTAHRLAIQKTSPMDQPYDFSRVVVAAPQPYSKTLTAIMAIQGSHTIQLRERPMMSLGVSPTR